MKTITLTASEVKYGNRHPDLSRTKRRHDAWGLIRIDGKLDPINLEILETKGGLHAIERCELFGDMWAVAIYAGEPHLFEEAADGYHRLVICVECETHIEKNPIALDVPYGSTKWDSAFSGLAFFCSHACLQKFEEDDDLDCKDSSPRCEHCGGITSSSIRVFLQERGGGPAFLCSSKCVVGFSKHITESA